MDDSQQQQKDKYLIDLSKYEIIEEFDKDRKTHCNKVFFIKNKENNKKYVAKSSPTKLDSDQLKSFTRELKIFIYIQHPTIVKFKGYSYQDMENRNNVTIITKFMEKGSLAELITSDILDNTNRQIILTGIAFGMMLLHNYYIIHRDLKPENVLLDNNYYPLLADFGTSKIIDPLNPTNNTMKGIGTLYYMAPEILRGYNYDIMVDVYSFSILMSEIVLRKRAYSDLNERQIFFFTRQVTDCYQRPEIESIRTQYPGFAKMMGKCWDDDVGERPSFYEIFKKLSLLSNEDIEKFESKFTFLKNDHSNLLSDEYTYSFDNVDTNKLRSYVEMLFSNLGPKKVTEIDKIFYRTKEICKEFFLLVLKNGIKNEDKEGEDHEFLQNLCIFLPNDLQPILSDILIGSFKMLTECFIFEDFNDNLKEILHKDDLFNHEGSLKIVSYYTFSSWVSICLSILKQQKIDFSLCLSLLNKILRIDSIYHDIAFSCFINLLSLSIEKVSSIENFKTVVKEIAEFYINLSPKQFIDSRSNEVLYSILRKYIKDNEELNSDSIAVVNLISNILIHNPSLMDNQTVYIVFYLTKNFVDKFEKNCLNLFLEMSKFLDNNCVQVFLDIAQDSFRKIPFNEAVNLFSLIIKSLNDAVLYKKSFASKFISMMPSFFHIAMSIEIDSLDAKQTQDIFTSLIDFWHDVYLIDNSLDNSIIESLIGHFFDKIEKIKTIQKLVQLLAGNKRQSLSPDFNIMTSFPLRLLVKLFLMTNQVCNVLMFISSLCSFSENNCIKCHECELDSLIIDILSKWRKRMIKFKPKQFDEKYDFSGFVEDENNVFITETKEGDEISEDLIELLLHLFSLIALKISSVSTVHKLFSVLCPFRYKESLRLSLIHIKVIDSLIKILHKSRFAPYASLEMPSKPISVLNIPSRVFKDGFSLIFWIYKSSLCNQPLINVLKFSEKKPLIQSLIVKNLSSLNLQINENGFNLNIKSGTQNKDYVIEQDKIPLNDWTMVTITINCSNISFYINKRKVYSEETENLLFQPNYFVDCIINDINATIADSDPYLFGNFILSSPLVDEEISLLVSNGQKLLFSKFCNSKLIFSFIPQQSNGELTFKNICQINEISSIFPRSDYHKVNSFSDLLCENNNLELIIPIFQQYDLLLRDGTSGKFINADSILILSNLFLLGDDVQQLFCNSNYFYSISNCLQHINVKSLTDTVYMLYNDLLDLISFEELRVQLINVILMDYNLWKRIDINQQKIIFKHWNDSLYTKYKNIINSYKSFEWFLFIIQDCNDADIRENLFSIAFGVFRNKPSSELISLAISLIIFQSTSFIQQSPLTVNKEMIDLLNSIFSDKSIVDSIQVDYADFFNLIFTIFVDNKIDDEFIYKIISLFVSIKANGVNIEAPLRNIAIILNIYEEFLFSKDIYLELISLMNLNDSIEILPILCINAINKGEEYFAILEKQAKNDIDYYIDDELTIYSALLIFKFFNNKDFYHKSIEFNLSIYRNHLPEFINVIDSLGLLGFCPNEFDQIRSDIYNNLFKRKVVLSNEKNAVVGIILNNIKEFLFLRLDNNEPLNSLLRINYDDSICSKNDLETFFISFKKFGYDESDDIKVLKNMNLVFESLHNYQDKKKLNINQQMKNYHSEVNLRLNGNNWLDLELVKKIFDFYISNEVIQLNEFMGTLASCTSKYASKYIKSTKSRLSKPLNFKIEQLNMKSIQKKFKFIFINCVKNILTIFKPVNLQSMNQLNDIYHKYHSDFEIKENQFNDMKQSIYKNIMNSLTTNRSGWSKLKTRLHKSVYKRNNLFCCRYCCPLNVHKKSFKFTNKVKSERPNKSELIKCKLSGIKSDKDSLIEIERKSINIFYDDIKKVVPLKHIYLAQHLFRDKNSYKFHIIKKDGENFNLIFGHSEFLKLTKLMDHNSFSSSNRVNSIRLLKKLTDSWVNGNKTNFEYLLKLNFLNGRNFEDLKYYPIFPWVLSNYDSPTLDLDSDSIYRDLSKPINDDDKPIKPFEFNVCYWLFRIEPFLTKYNENKENYSSVFDSIAEVHKEATTELIPEFFFLPEFLKSKEFGDVTLPPWANQSATEFIYLHRKALESKFVTEHLNEWIDLTWGVKRKKNVENHSELFDENHPKRIHFVPKSSIQFFNDGETKFVTIKFNELSAFVNGDVSLNLDDSQLCFSMIDICGNVYFYSVGFDSFDAKKISVKSEKLLVKDENLLNQSVLADLKRVCFIDKDKKSVNILNCESGQIEKTIEKSSEILSFCVHSNSWLGISTDDSSMSIYDIQHLPPKKQSSIPSFLSLLKTSSNNDKFVHNSEKFFSYPGKVECIEISSIFNLFVCGTNDNRLLFCQLNLDKMKINRVVKTVEKPSKILITDNFGFIVVLTEKNEKCQHLNELNLFSLNGEKIRSLSISVGSITKASSHDKFDYLIVADKENRIFVIEAFYLKLSQPIFECKSRIVKLAYIEEESLIIAFCQNGTATVIYYPIG